MNAEAHFLTGAYAVDAVDDRERAMFEEHLVACTACRLEVDSLRAAAVELSVLTEQVPSARLRAHVLAVTRTVRPQPPSTSPGGVGVVRRRKRLARLAAAAAVVALVGGGRSRQSLPGGASATLVRSQSLGRAALVTRDMPAAPAGKVYQLWLQRPDGQMVSAGLMPPGPDQTVLLGGDAASARAAAISVEPTGGSTTPTTTPIALFTFG